jgi:poly-gamma-glutamate capsule biosynthesis protein CapA/YwtB (metallophosphatase superfamily)
MLYDSEHRDLSIALLGDVMPTRRLAVFREERYVTLRELLVQADAAFANLETCVHRYLEGRLGISGGTYMTTEPHLLEDLKWLGVNLASCTNNHAFDYGEDGILATCGYLDAAGIVHAGTGRNLREERSPAYLEIPNGRIALIAVSSQFRPHMVAGEQRPDVPGRPGINPLRHRTTYTVDERSLEDLSRIGASLGFNVGKEQGELSAELRPSSTDRKYAFGGMKSLLSGQVEISTT